MSFENQYLHMEKFNKITIILYAHEVLANLT